MEDLNLNKLDKKAQNGELTEENVEEILNTMREISSKAEDIKILNEIKENPLKPGEEGTANIIGTTNVLLDPVSGAKINVCEGLLPIEEKEVTINLEDKFKDIVDSLEDDESISDKFEITADQIPEATNAIFNIPEDAQEENALTKEETVKILDIINRVQDGEKFNIYNEFPPTIQKMIDNTMNLKGYGDKSTRSNTVRNKICLEIIASYITLIKKEKYENSFIKKIEALQQTENINFANLYNEYDKNKQEFLESLLESLDENDPRRETVSKKLDIMEDSYSLKSLKEYVSTHRVKIKPIEYEKPQQRIYDVLESKYRYNDNYHIIAIHNALQILGRHNKKDDKENLKFFAAFSKMCMNYNIDDSDNHLLIYSVLRNIVFLDVFKGEEYVKFATPFLQNIEDVISKIK